jgi:L-iditol 2-dehydrogenase
MDERKTVMPVILGHEYVGQVTETCGDTGDFRTGDTVVTLPACYSCGVCEFCREGLVTLCSKRKSIGTHVDGTMAEYVIVPAKYSFKVPDDAEDIIAYALAEPFNCTVRGVYERISVKPGDVAVVSGPGTIGLFALQALKTRGAYVIVSGLPDDRHRLELALKLGADAVADQVEDLKSKIAQVNPRGADLVVEAAGHPGSIDTCLQVARMKATMLVLGTYGGKMIPCRFDTIFDKEMDVFASNSSSMSSWKIGLRLIREKKVDLGPLVSLKLPLAEWRQGFDAVINRKAYKVVFCPGLDN